MTDVSSTTLFTFPEDRDTDLRRIVRGPDGAPFVVDAGHRDASTGSTSRTARRRSSFARATPSWAGRKARRSSWPSAGAISSSSMTGIPSGAGRPPTAPARDPAPLPERRLRIGRVGRRHPRDRDVHPELRREPLQPVRRRPVVAAGPALLPGGGRRRLPGAADEVALGAARRQRHHLDVHRRRRLARRRRGRAPRRRREQRGLGRGRPRTTTSSGPPPRTGSSTPVRPGARARSTPSTRRTTGSSRCPRSTARFLGQYRLAEGSDAWADMRDFYVESSVEGQPDAIVWISENAIHRAVLESVTSAPASSPSPSEAASDDQ